MKNVTSGAQRLIERDNLGIPIEVYKPNMPASIVIGTFVIVFGIIWCIMATLIIDGSHFLFQQSTPSFTTSSSSSPSFSSDPSSVSSSGLDFLGTGWTVFGIVFPLIGLFVAGWGVVGIVRATRNRNTQAVVCTDGVAYVTPTITDAFRWEQVLTVINKTSVSTSTTPNENGMSNTRTTTHHKYNVHCHDGRTFAFDDTLSKVEDLAERIEVEVARYCAQAG